MRRLLVPVFIVSLMVSGLAYAAGDASVEDETVRSSVSDTGARPETDDQSLEASDESSEDSEDVDRTGSSQVSGTGRSTEGCPEGFSGNHGQFVSSTDDRPRRDAAHSPCGKPLQSDHNEEQAEPSTEEVESEDEDDGNGLKKGHDKSKNKNKSKHRG